MGPMFSLEGKNAAVVGGGSGIGEAVAIAMAEQGAYVACLDINLDKLIYSFTVEKKITQEPPLMGLFSIWNG